MLQNGYFDDSLPTRRTIYSYMRLRALRCVYLHACETGACTLLTQKGDYFQLEF